MRRVAPSFVGIRGPYVIWDGERDVAGDLPMAPLGEGRNVALGTEKIRMIPDSHAGGVDRVYLGFFTSVRARAVRK